MRVAWVVAVFVVSGCLCPVFKPPTVFSHRPPAGEAALSRTGDLLSITISPSTESIGIQIENRSADRIRVDWNEVIFVEPDGSSEPVVHEGVRLIDRDKPQSPSIIYPRTSLTDSVVPTSRIYWRTGSGSVAGGWETRPLIYDVWAGRAWRLIVPVYVGADPAPRVFDFAVVSTPVAP